MFEPWAASGKRNEKILFAGRGMTCVVMSGRLFLRWIVYGLRPRNRRGGMVLS